MATEGSNQGDNAVLKNNDGESGIAVFDVKEGFDGQVVVDLSSELGPIKIHNAVNGAPPLRGDVYFEEWAEAEIPYARIHDLNLIHAYGAPYVVDVPWIFRDFDADENDPKSYDFACTDAILKRIQDAGTKVFYRLGAAYENSLVKKYTLFPPKDYGKWARIAEHIIMHYTQGWADGFEWDIGYWEIWNEPNLRTRDNGSENGGFWRGSRDEFKKFFKIVLKHLKSRFPNLKIGGPAMAGTGGEWGKEILSELARDGVPLDFYSWHGYATEPRKFAEDARFVREILDNNGFTKAESIFNEWNYVKGWTPGDFTYSRQVESGPFNQKGAAFIGAAMTVLQNEKVDMSMFYDARARGMNNLFDHITSLPLRGYYTFIAWRNLRKLGIQVSAASSLNDIYVTAAKNKEGKWGIFIVRYDEDNNVTAPVLLSIKFASAGSFNGAKCYLTDDARIFTLKGLSQSDDGTVSLTMRPCSFAYIESF